MKYEKHVQIQKHVSIQFAAAGKKWNTRVRLYQCESSKDRKKMQTYRGQEGQYINAARTRITRNDKKCAGAT